jgi:flagellar basal body-associated protein FliL
MPEFTIIHIGIGLVALTAVIGVIVGWLLRGNRCAQEKIVVNAGWQEQLEAQRVEHERLLGQNKNLMEQISEFQASGADANNRAKELSTALKENFAQREELQREIKEIRGRLETAIGERDGLQTDMVDLSVSGESLTSALQQKDDKIFRYSGSAVSLKIGRADCHPCSSDFVCVTKKRSSLRPISGRPAIACRRWSRCWAPNRPGSIRSMRMPCRTT